MVDRVVELEVLALLTRRARCGSDEDRVLAADERSVVDLEPDLAGLDVLFDEHGQRIARERPAVWAAEVGPLVQYDGRIDIAERAGIVGVETIDDGAGVGGLLAVPTDALGLAPLAGRRAVRARAARRSLQSLSAECCDEQQCDGREDHRRQAHAAIAAFKGGTVE